MVKKLLYYGIGIACIEIGYRMIKNNFAVDLPKNTPKYRMDSHMRSFMVRKAREGEPFSNYKYGLQPDGTVTYPVRRSNEKTIFDFTKV